MTASADPAQTRAAARVQQHNPRWLIIWGTHSRQYWACPRFDALPRTIITAPDIAELTSRMHYAELAARTPSHSPRSHAQRTGSAASPH